jgi:sugar/nucleoside kinase (ribokinase family)
VWRLAVVGNLSLDVVDGRPPRPGGGPFHCARALRVLGVPAVVAAQCVPDHRPALVPPLVALGVPVAWRPSSATAAFTIRYSGESRAMTVDGVGDPWTPEDARGWLGGVIGRSEWVHAAGLARSDFPAETLAELARGRRLSLDGQALVRPGHSGALTLDGDFDPAVLEHVSVLKLAEEELEATGREPADFRVPEVLVTRGARGVLVYAGGRVEEVRAHAVGGGVDPTGAGDAFVAVYLVARGAGQRPAAAARRAAGLVADLLAGRLA